MDGVPDMSGNVQVVRPSQQTMTPAKNPEPMETKEMSMCEYLKDHIIEELEGAKDYMMKAVEYRITKPEWSKKFYKMSEMEAEHANCLSKMFNSMDTDEICHAEMYKEIMDAYNVNMLEVSNLKKLYYS